MLLAPFDLRTRIFHSRIPVLFYYKILNLEKVYSDLISVIMLSFKGWGEVKQFLEPQFLTNLMRMYALDVFIDSSHMLDKFWDVKPCLPYH